MKRHLNNHLNTISGLKNQSENHSKVQSRNDRIKSATTTVNHVKRRVIQSSTRGDRPDDIINATISGPNVLSNPKQSTMKRNNTNSLGITLNNLQEGEVFDNEIDRIMSIVSNVEKQFGGKSVNKDFMNALHIATQQR